MRNKFVAQEGELSIIKPQCKSCKNVILDDDLNCKVNETIDLKIMLNKEKCKYFEEEK